MRGFSMAARMFWAARPATDEIEPLSRALAEAGKQHSAPEYLRSIQIMQAMSRRVARFFETFDVWLTPTLAQPPLVLGSFDSTPEEPMRAMAVAGAFAPFTAIANMTGQPAMSVPLFWNREGIADRSPFRRQVWRRGDPLQACFSAREGTTLGHKERKKDTRNTKLILCSLCPTLRAFCSYL